MSTIIEKQYISNSKKKIKQKKDMSAILMFRDFKKSRNIHRNDLYKNKYYSDNEETDTNEDIITNKVNIDEWIVLPKTVPHDHIKPTLLMSFLKYFRFTT